MSYWNGVLDLWLWEYHEVVYMQVADENSGFYLARTKQLIDWLIDWLAVARVQGLLAWMVDTMSVLFTAGATVTSSSSSDGRLIIVRPLLDCHVPICRATQHAPHTHSIISSSAQSAKWSNDMSVCNVHGVDAFVLFPVYLRNQLTADLELLHVSRS